MFSWTAGLVSSSPQLNKFTTLESDDEMVMFMPPIYASNKTMDIRSNVMGQEKNGLEFMFANDKYKIMYSILFNQHDTVTLLDLKTYRSLIKDLRFTQNFLDPFMNFFKIHRNIDDSKELKFILDQSPLSLPD